MATYSREDIELVSSMRVLFISPWIPSRIRPRSLEFLNVLALQHEVHFIGVAGRGEIKEDLPRNVLASVTLVHHSVTGGLCRASRALFTRQSLQASYAGSKRARTAIGRSLARIDPDVVFLNVARSYRLLPASWTGTVITDLDEYRSDYYKQTTDLSPFGKAVGRVESPRLEALERKMIERSDAVLFSSPRDAGRAGVKGHCIGSVVVSPGHHVGASCRPNVVLVGRFGYAPNARGAAWFLRDVWPRVLSANRSANLYLVGERPSRSLRRCEDPSVHITGAVDSVWPYYHEAAAAVVPIFTATGVQLKLLQALASGIPTIVTPIVAELASVRDGDQVLVASTPDEWVNALNHILTDKSLCTRLSTSGREWFENNFSPDEVHRRLLNLLGGLPRTGH